LPAGQISDLGISVTARPPFALPGRAGAQNPVRQKSNFVSAIKLICPVQSSAQKYFGFSETQITAI
jgi:hypothetical protein